MKCDNCNKSSAFASMEVDSFLLNYQLPILVFILNYYCKSEVLNKGI